MSGRAAGPLTTAPSSSPPSPLFRDYLAERAGRAAVLRSGGPLGPGGAARRRRAHAPRASASRWAAVPTRSARQQEERGAPARRRACRARSQPGTRSRLSPGSRPVLFGGPLFVLYKALARDHGRAAPAGASAGRRWCRCSGSPPTITTSRRSARRSGARRGGRSSARCATRRVHEPAGQPAAQVRPRRDRDALVEELARRIPPGLHRDARCRALRRCYRPGAIRLSCLRPPPSPCCSPTSSSSTPPTPRSRRPWSP